MGCPVCRKRRIRAFHDEGDPRAAEGGAGHDRFRFQGRKGGRQSDRPLGRGDPRDPQHLHRGLRQRLPRGHGGAVRHRGFGEDPRARGAGLGIPVPLASHRRGDARRRDQPVRRDGGFAGCTAGGEGARRQDARHRQRRRIHHRAGGGPRLLHAGRPGDRRGDHQGLQHPAHRGLRAGAGTRARARRDGRREVSRDDRGDHDASGQDDPDP